MITTVNDLLNRSDEADITIYSQDRGVLLAADADTDGCSSIFIRSGPVKVRVFLIKTELAELAKLALDTANEVEKLEAAQKAAKNNGKTKRFQLVFDAETSERAYELAKADARSFNNLMEWLIKQEWSRREKTT